MLRGALSRRGKGHDMQRRFPGRTGRKTHERASKREMQNLQIDPQRLWDS